MRAASSWRCRCGYANLGVDRCEVCRRPSRAHRRRIRRRRVVSAACIAVSCMAAHALWSPDTSSAKAALAAVSPPPAPAPVPAPAPSHPSKPSAPKTAARSVRAPRVAVVHQSASAPTSDRCQAARQAVESAGDYLGTGYDFRCPNSEYPRWGATSLRPCGSCFVEINPAAVGPNNAKLRYVVAHEFCHSHGIRDEQAADACAASYGFPNIYFAR
jgi:hypothetical protein